MDVRKSYGLSYERALAFCRPLVAEAASGVPPVDAEMKTATLYEAANTAIDEVEGPHDADSFYELGQELVACLAEDVGIKLVEDELGAWEAE